MKILDEQMRKMMLAKFKGIAHDTNGLSFELAVELHKEFKDIDWSESKKNGFTKMEMMENIVNIPGSHITDSGCLRQVLHAGEFIHEHMPEEYERLVDGIGYWSFHNIARARLSNDDDDNIAAKIVLTKRVLDGELAVGKIKAEINKIKDRVMPKALDELLLLFNTWGIQRPDTRFGIEHPGQIPGQIVLNVLYHYLPEDAVIVDPMSGGGSTHDVVEFLNSLQFPDYNFKCHSFDLAPRRDFIKPVDSLLDDWNVTDADLVFLDPPYFSMMKDDYVPNAFTESRESFYNAMRTILTKAYNALKTGGVCSLIIQPQTEKDVDFAGGEVCIDTPYECMKIMEQVGFKTYQRIQTPLSTQQFNATDMKRVKKYEERHRLLGTARDLILMKKV